MKKNIRVTSALLILVVVLAAGTHNLLTAKSAGAPAGNTGSPADGQSCAHTGCHSGTSVERTGIISTTVPATGYLEGETYTVTVTAEEAGIVKFGFQASPQDAAGNILGVMELTDAVQTKLLSGGAYITHTSSGNSGADIKTWSFNWTPAGSTGDVTFYAAINTANNENNASGDKIYFSSLKITEDPDNIPLAITTPSTLDFDVMVDAWSMAILLPQAATSANIVITDLSGRIYWRQAFSSAQRIDIDRQDWAKGVYLVRAQADGIAGVRKVLVM